MFKEIYKEALKIDSLDVYLEEEEKRVFPSAREVDRLLPDCYTVGIRGSKEEKLDKFSEGTLFYVFFFHCGEKIQKEAFHRLLSMHWAFSKEMKTFLRIVKRLPNESGLILYFDYCTWKKVTKEIKLDQEFLNTLIMG
ncbi:hypothetical protein NEFER03_0428 [Nematocida sp. LUAm3]|nr:hypothetical protein NEFER03_0428 [Nematocida sp. LUAm3]KAI5175886.1 hypothetical protein NEFER02_1746 [Nematocida sp. LUAm2]KAI5178732.1 hypothetical protein NEFER01_1851 [Nematocida sp. LUAm1]